MTQHVLLCQYLARELKMISLAGWRWQRSPLRGGHCWTGENFSVTMEVEENSKEIGPPEVKSSQEAAIGHNQGEEDRHGPSSR